MKHIIIGLGKTKKYISLDAIVYFEGESNYSYIHCFSKKEYVSVGLKKWEDRLSDKFIRIHRKYLVNISLIEKVFENQVYLKNGKVFDISRRRQKLVIEKIDFFTG